MAANRAKSEFIANMSHELRTPLNAVIGFSTMIKDQVMGPLGSPRYAEYAADILSSGTHLLGIVNDILDVSKIEAGKLEISEELIEIEPIAASCLRFVSRHAEERRIKLVSAVPADLPALHGDERLIKQIVANLLSNAVKFTPEGGSVSLEAAREADGSIAIVVRDTGIGIAPEHIPNLGKPFFQADTSTARTHDGTGLGLYLVAKFVALHGGTVDYESAPGQGTTVTVRLPAARVSEPDWASITAAVA
jgi:signal transduction histidine kinase